MDYVKHYNLLIERARNRKVTCYVERHHIIPRCMGGTDDADNLVLLTAEEHYVAHQLLVKMHPDNHLILYAARMMTIDNKVTGVNRTKNKLYGWLKRRIVEARSKQMSGRKHSEETKRKIGASNKGLLKGRTLDATVRAKISASLAGRIRGPMSEEQKQKLREVAKPPHTEERRKEIGNFHRGKKLSEETKAKMRKPKSPEMRSKLSASRLGKKFPRTKQIQQ